MQGVLAVELKHRALSADWIQTEHPGLLFLWGLQCFVLCGGPHVDGTN